MNAPLISVVAVYIAGILIGASLEVDWVGVFACTGFLLVLSLILKSYSVALFYCAIFFTGWANMAHRVSIIAPHDLRNLFGEKPAIVTIRGELLESPIIKNPQKSDHAFSQAMIEVKAVEVDGIRMSSFGRVIARTSGSLSTNYFIGREVSVTGVLKKPNGATAEGFFDYQKYLRWQGVYHLLESAGTHEWELANPSDRSVPYSERFNRWARRALVHGLDEKDSTSGLMIAMALGWRPGIPDELAAPFMRSGTMHVFAISGLHITLIAGILLALFRVFRLPSFVCGLLVLPLIWGYTGATGWQSSAIRSALMVTFLIGGWAMKKPLGLLNSLLASALLILLVEPRQLFQASFQLSFFVVLSIVIFTPMLEPLRQKITAGDPLLPAQLRSFWRRCWDSIIRWVSLMVIVSLAAWVGSIPLVAHYFHLFTPSGMVANLVVVPLSGFELMCNVGTLICFAWSPILAELFSHSAWFWMNCMVSVSEWSAELPGGYWFVRGFTSFELIVYHLVFTAIAVNLFKPKSLRKWTLAMLGCLLILCTFLRMERVGRHELTLLSGHNSILHDAPGNQNDLLIDVRNPQAARIVVNQLVQSKGMNQIPTVLITHADSQHYRGISALAEEWPDLRVSISESGKQSAAFAKRLASVEQMGGQIIKIQRNDHIGDWRILHPPTDANYSRADDNAVVLFGEFNGARILLLSDLGEAGQKALLAAEKDLRCDIVVVGISNQGGTLGEELLKATQPQFVLIADDGDALTQRAERHLMLRLLQSNATVISLRKSGSLTIELRNHSCALRTVGGQRYELARTEWNSGLRQH